MFSIKLEGLLGRSYRKSPCSVDREGDLIINSHNRLNYSGPACKILYNQHLLNRNEQAQHSFNTDTSGKKNM
uniref:Protein LIKE COV 2 n=1 Tax=Rhizophora mucronata TaxID=61149 RepID=A0A2P2M5M6_RHIMU